MSRPSVVALTTAAGLALLSTSLDLGIATSAGSAPSSKSKPAPAAAAPAAAPATPAAQPVEKVERAWCVVKALTSSTPPLDDTGKPMPYTIRGIHVSSSNLDETQIWELAVKSEKTRILSKIGVSSGDDFVFTFARHPHGDATVTVADAPPKEGAPATADSNLNATIIELNGAGNQTNGPLRDLGELSGTRKRNQEYAGTFTARYKVCVTLTGG